MDVAFTRIRLAVHIDGCFWHGCEEHFIPPKTNREYWEQKIARNRDRDADTDEQLRSTGWTVLRFWEHDDPLRVVEELESVLRVIRAAIL